METNRPTTGADAPEPFAVYRSKKLLARRQALADAGIEHLGHDLPGTDQLWWALQQVEERIRREFPVIWGKSHADCVFPDAAGLHSADRCRICRQRQVPPEEARSSTPLAHPRSSTTWMTLIIRRRAQEPGRAGACPGRSVGRSVEPVGVS